MKIPALLPLAALFLASPSFGQAVFSNGFEPPQDPVQAYDCNVEGVMPSNFNVLMSTWTGTFSSPDGSPAASYPNGVSFPTPVGAPRTYMRVVPFVPNPAQTVLLYWDEAQSRPSEGYQPSRPADGMWFAISPCIGDMRKPNAVGEAFLRGGCREFERAAALVWTTADSVPDSDESVCKLEAGKTYYLTISPTNVLDGLQFGEHTCQGGDFGCDVGVVLSQSTGN